MTITQSRLHELVTYNPITGLFTSNTNGHAFERLSVWGYVIFSLDNRQYRSHRLAFLYMTGSIPDVIDHKNRIRNDNRWTNIRSSTKQDNARNAKVSKSNQLKHQGITKVKKTGKYVARVTVDGKYIHLGTFTTLKDAISARNKANIKYGFTSYNEQ